jgi:DeoR/GlpR family transcriptional regulator of sugar metabolism
MSKKSSRGGLIIPVAVGAVAAAVSYVLFKDDISKSVRGGSASGRKNSSNKSIKSKKMARYPTKRKKGRPKGASSQTDRIKKILSIINEKKEFSLSSIRYRFPSVTKRTLRRDLEKLERDGKVVRKGNTRSTIYLKS